MQHVFVFGDILLVLGEILLVLALLGIIAVTVWLAMTALHLKTAVVTNAGRLYKRPLNAGKNLVITGKGIVQQETVRVKHIGTSVKTASGAVVETVIKVKDAAQEIHPEDLKPALAALKNASHIASLAAGITRSAAHQRFPSSE